MLNKFLALIKRHKLLSGVVLVILLILLSRGIIRNEVGVSPEDESAGRKVVEDLQNNFESRPFLDLKNIDLKLNATFSQQEVSSVNFDSNVFSIESLSTPEIVSTLGASFVVYDTSSEIRLETRGTLETFLNDYQQMLNAPMREIFGERFKFTPKLVAKNFVALDEEHQEFYGQNMTQDQATHESLTYRIYLNNYIVSRPERIIVLDVLRPIKDATLPTLITIPKFFPKKISLISRVSFDSGTKMVKPTFGLDPDFIITLIESGETLSQEDFVIPQGSSTLLYIFDGQYLTPLLAKNATLTKFPELSDKTVILMAF